MSQDIDNLLTRSSFRELYGDNVRQRERWRRLAADFTERFGPRETRFFSSPGRAELCGNHTDHNGGVVLAAAVDLDSIAVVTVNEDNVVRLAAEGYDEPFVVDLGELNRVDAEAGTTAALIRGGAARLDELGFKIGGFDACVTSDVLVGSGLSSSASIEVLIGSMFGSLYNSGIEPMTVATVGQYAENNYFGKPCGLMDQISCAFGGILRIDFRDESAPAVEKVECKFDSKHLLVVVDTGGSHAELTEEYAAIRNEMAAVAQAFGKQRVCELTFDELLADIKRLRPITGDRAILRAVHFLGENERVSRQVEALEAEDFRRFLGLVNEGGDSSWELLQNCYSTANVSEQGISLALALTRQFLGERGSGACRVQGGGFAGTIQAWIPADALADYQNLIEPIFGSGSVVVLNIRERPSGEIFE